jgi:hypothetical protein
MRSTVSLRLPRLVLATAATSFVASAALALSTPATISIDGQRLVSEVPPVTTLDGHAYVPLRVVSEASGAQTTFDPQTGAVTVRRNGDVLSLHPGSAEARLNGHKVTLAHAPFTVRGRMMVAGATIARTFGTSVRFDAKHGRVVVRTPGVVVAGAADDEP